MSLSYTTIMNADLKQLKEAADKWRILPDKLGGIYTDFQTTVANGLSAEAWEGEAANAARKTIGTTSGEIHSASGESGGIGSLLSSAHYKLNLIQKRLESIASEISESKHLSMTSAGEVIFNSPEKDPSRRIAIQGGYKETIPEYNRRIRALINEATEADESLSWALSQDRNGRKAGFNNEPYYSIKDAGEARDAAARDSKKAEEIIRLGPEANDKQLTWLNTVAVRREGDPFFSEKVATGAGPKKVLEFWVTVDQRNMSPEREKIFAKLEKSLGNTLATASQSDSGAMKKWKQEMIEIGRDRVNVENLDRGSKKADPYGFQVMSALMRNGEYDREFLHDYSSEALKYERTAGGSNVWEGTGGVYRLSLEASDSVDPFSGIMQALGNNPEAAQDVFSKKEDLKYFMKERDWIHYNEDDSSPDGKLVREYEELGRALESATLGVPWNQEGLNRDAKSAGIAANVIEIVGSDPESRSNHYLHDKPDLVESMAKIGAGYIDDINKAASKDPDMLTIENMDSGVFGSGNGRIPNLGHEDVQNFLMEVGKQKAGYEILSTAQDAYTSSLVAHNENDRDKVESALLVGGANHGFLDGARSHYLDWQEATGATGVAKEREESQEWREWGVTQALGTAGELGGIVAGGAAGAVIAGPPGAAVGAVAVPVVLDVGVSALDKYLSLQDVEQPERPGRGLDTERMSDASSIRFRSLIDRIETDFGDGGAQGVLDRVNEKKDRAWDTTEYFVNPKKSVDE